jgi:hypothetical protein
MQKPNKVSEIIEGVIDFNLAKDKLSEQRKETPADYLGDFWITFEE